MSYSILTAGAFCDLVAPLIGLPISRPWKGYGSAIFLELGTLTPIPGNGRPRGRGEACIRIEWDWRVESGHEVLCGSSNSNPEITAKLQSLSGVLLTSLMVEGRVPEVVAHFSNSHCLRSMAMVDGNPQWSIRIPDGRYIHAEAGQCLIGNGDEAPAAFTDEEKASLAQAKRAAQRWGTPNASPVRGACHDCACYVPLDGQGHLLDYGVCTSEEGPLDGRVVNMRSGCASFVQCDDA